MDTTAKRSVITIFMGLCVEEWASYGPGLSRQVIWTDQSRIKDLAVCYTTLCVRDGLNAEAITDEKV